MDDRYGGAGGGAGHLDIVDGAHPVLDEVARRLGRGHPVVTLLHGAGAGWLDPAPTLTAVLREDPDRAARWAEMRAGVVDQLQRALEETAEQPPTVGDVELAAAVERIAAELVLDPDGV